MLKIQYFFKGISGPSGTGKSFLTNSYVRKLSKEKFITNVINFSARTSTNYTQDVIMSKLDRRRKGVFGPAMGKKCIVFVDDLNLPQTDDVGSIPPVELLRQVRNYSIKSCISWDYSAIAPRLVFFPWIWGFFCLQKLFLTSNLYDWYFLKQ